jgi:hypothetical protein
LLKDGLKKRRKGREKVARRLLSFLAFDDEAKGVQADKAFGVFLIVHLVRFEG